MATRLAGPPRRSVCYKRAAGRLHRERDRADASFMKGVVRTEVLPTAVASCSDNYIILDPYSFLTAADEVMQRVRIRSPPPESFANRPGRRAAERHTGGGVPETQRPRGRGSPGNVHTTEAGKPGTRTELRVSIFRRGHIRGCGRCDRQPVAVCLCQRARPSTRAALLHAWGVRGLSATSCYTDARGSDVLKAPSATGDDA